MRVGGQTLARVATLINSHQLSSSFDGALIDLTSINSSNTRRRTSSDFQTSSTLLIFFGLGIWIINELEKYKSQL